MKWYAVRLIFKHSRVDTEDFEFAYEERITIWNASSELEAHKLARKEAASYAEIEGCEVSETSDCSVLFDPPTESGAEVWFAVRRSNLDFDNYQKTFAFTGGENFREI